VKDGKTGVYELKLRDDAGKLYARDGTFSVAYVNGAGESRCKGEAAVSAKDQRHEGEFYVEIPFKPACTTVKTLNETKVTYTFKTAKGAVLTKAASDNGDLSTWDNSLLMEQRFAKEAEDAKPAVIAEKTRLGSIAALVPAPGQPLKECPSDVAAALKKDPPARLSYDVMLVFASKPPEAGHEQLSFMSEGLHAVMASGDPQNAATDARMPGFKPPAYVEVARVSTFKPWRIISTADKHGSYEHGELFADVSVIDIAQKQVVCGGPLAVQTSKSIEGDQTDRSVQENLAQNYRAARSALEAKLVGGDIPPTP
jgi:hypothetical protein